jgi:Flp pilus assembly protein TadG
MTPDNRPFDRPPARRKRWALTLRRAARQEGGAAAAEFALVMPVLALLYLGGYELESAMTIYHRMSDATREMANIASQNTSTNLTSLCSQLSAASVVLSPFSATPMTMDLYEIQTDANNNASVTWHVSYKFSNSTCTDSGSAATWTMPTNLSSPSSSYILASSSYAYAMTVGAKVMSAIPIPTLTDQIYFVPRESASIPCSSC